ncbi:MAG TPA: hypothetical protein V6D31_03345 [Candidatus Sericytochromatia bacterium]
MLYGYSYLINELETAKFSTTLSNFKIVRSHLKLLSSHPYLIEETLFTIVLEVRCVLTARRDCYKFAIATT